MYQYLKQEIVSLKEAKLKANIIATQQNLFFGCRDSSVIIRVRSKKGRYVTEKMEKEGIF